MSEIDLRYGESSVRLNMSGAKSVEILTGMDVPPISDFPRAFRLAVEDECIDSQPLRQLLSPGDKVTLIISDITRFWMRQDKICPLLVEYLHTEARIPYENIVILIALGGHRPQTEQEMKTLVTPEVFQKVRVLNHDCEADDLVHVGRTPRGNDVFANPLAAGGRKVIVLSGTSYHLMSGYSGGRKSILPGISGLETIRRNHIHSLSPDTPKTNPLIGLGVLEKNPVHEDMSEAARLVAPVFGVNIAVNSHGDICRIIAGDFEAAWEESCRECERCMGVPIREKADIVVVSCGGFPKDINLYQGCKSLINVTQAARDGGEIVFFARCQEGGGTPAFFNWIEPLRKGELDAALRAESTIDGYIFYAFCEALARFDVHLLTDIPPGELAGMSIRVYSDAGSLLRNVDFTDKKVYVMPFGGNTVPFLQKNIPGRNEV